MYFPPSIRIHLQIPQEQNNPTTPSSQGCLGCRHSAISFQHGEILWSWDSNFSGFPKPLQQMVTYVTCDYSILKVEMIVGLPFWKRVPSSDSKIVNHQPQPLDGSNIGATPWYSNSWKYYCSIGYAYIFNWEYIVFVKIAYEMTRVYPMFHQASCSR